MEAAWTGVTTPQGAERVSSVERASWCIAVFRILAGTLWVITGSRAKITCEVVFGEGAAKEPTDPAKHAAELAQSTITKRSSVCTENSARDAISAPAAKATHRTGFGPVGQDFNNQNT